MNKKISIIIIVLLSIGLIVTNIDLPFTVTIEKEEKVDWYDEIENGDRMFLIETYEAYKNEEENKAWIPQANAYLTIVENIIDKNISRRKLNKAMDKYFKDVEKPDFVKVCEKLKLEIIDFTKEDEEEEE